MFRRTGHQQGTSLARLTTKGVEALKGTGKTRYEPVALGGSLVARGLANKIRYYYQYWHSGKKSRCPLGDHSRDGDDSGSSDSTVYNLAGARSRAVKLAALQREQGDLTAYMREQRDAATEATERAKENRSSQRQEARDYSLSNLCTAYWTHLETEGKASARDVRNALNRWVITKQPALARRKASEITTEDILSILRAIIDAGKTTTTNRVRSYLSSAYTFGLGSTTDPLASSRASGFRLTSNPAAPIKRIAAFETAGDRVLSSNELGELLRKLDARGTPAAKAVTLSIRLGGQRIKQLLDAGYQDYDPDNNTLTLRDGKGRRAHPRLHLLPIINVLGPLVVEALENPHHARQGLYNGLTMETASKLVREISKKQEAEGAEPYGWRDLRRTCETMLAKLGISKDLRAQIQSHGLSGIQDKHYDKYDYINEKRLALTAWNVRLDELQSGRKQAANVFQMNQQ